MKFCVTFKTPDVMFDAVHGMPDEQRAEAEAFASQYIEYDEYATIEFDTKAGTATVMKV